MSGYQEDMFNLLANLQQSTLQTATPLAAAPAALSSSSLSPTSSPPPRGSLVPSCASSQPFPQQVSKPPALPALPAPPTSKNWICTACTFINKPLHLSCEMCATAQPAPPQAPAPTATPSTPSKTTIPASFPANAWFANFPPNTMLIPIAPQCAGKTMILSSLAAHVDVTIDDEPGVYLAVPIKYWEIDGDGNPSAAPVPLPAVRKIGMKKRLDDNANAEQRFVLARLQGDIIEEELELLLSKLPSPRMRLPQGDLAKRLAAAVERYIGDCMQLQSEVLATPTSDLYIREAIFPDGVNGAQARLAAEAKKADQSVSWGNTNARDSDYACALEVAARTNRPVFFLKYKSEGFAADFDTLLYRNVARFAKTGRYIPSIAVAITENNVEKLLGFGRRLVEGGKMSELMWDQNLARAAGFRMDDARRIVGKEKKK